MYLRYFCFTMKKYILLLSFVFYYINLFAQIDAKRDNIWLFGYGSYYNLTHPKAGNTIVNFNTKPPANYFQYTDMNFNDDIAIISDTSGQLLFYTNGIYIADKTHQPMLNGKGLNPGKHADKFAKDGYILGQGSLILPKPGSNNLYYLFHSSFLFDGKQYYGDYLYYSLIDMNTNDGKGSVIEKNKVIIGNKLIDSGKLTACRHANGKDWWVLMSDYDNKKINTILLTENGVEIKALQTFSKGGERGGIGQAFFSPDGTKYVRFNAYYIYKTELSVFDFDRCTGKLSNLQYLESTKDTVYAVGMAISPNSKYLYASYNTKIYQYDLESKDIFATKDTVAIYDGFLDPLLKWPVTFYLLQLAPDGKIYISATNTTRYLHVIDEPDKKGKACNVKQHSFKLAKENYTTMPNFPNFRLGAAATPCNNVASEEVEKEKVNIKLYPNPTDNYIYIAYDKEKLQDNTLIINDIQGKIVFQKTLNEDKIDVTNYPNGIYFLQIRKEDKVIFREKIVILK